MERLHDMKIVDSYLSVQSKKEFIEKGIHSVKDAIFYTCLNKPNIKFDNKLNILKMYASLFPELTESNNPMCENYMEFLIELLSSYNKKVVTSLNEITDQIYALNFDSYDDMKQTIDNWLMLIIGESKTENIKRNIEIIKLFYGLDDNDRLNLDLIGNKYTLSRGRIQQIIARTKREIYWILHWKEEIV